MGSSSLGTLWDVVPSRLPSEKSVSEEIRLGITRSPSPQELSALSGSAATRWAE